MSKWKVVIPDRVKPPAHFEQEIFGPLADVVCLGAHTNSEMHGKIEDADAILAWHDLQWNKEVIGSLTQCKAIIRVGTGYDNVDLLAAKQKNIVVCNIPDYGTNDVADHAISLLMSLARGLMAHNKLSQKGPAHWKWGQTRTFRITGKNMGIIGLGAIGTATALRAKALGMNVGYFDPYKGVGPAKPLGIKFFETLDELAQWSDVISVHAPLTAETTGMLDERFFQSCKKGVVFINTARGPIVNWKAFSSAMTSGHVSQAGFDVLPVEPPHLDDPLLKEWCDPQSEIADKMIVTPHCAFYSEEAVQEMRQKAAREALRILQGKQALNQVNK